MGSRKKFGRISPAFTGRRRPISIFGAAMIAAISAPSSLVAAQEMPEFLYLHLNNVDPVQADHVNIDCHRDRNEMNCHFVKIFLLDPKKPEETTCEIVVTTYDTKFKMQSDKSWLSNSGEPRGFCGEVDIETLQTNPGTPQDASDWIYEVSATFTKPNDCGGIKQGTDRFTKNFTKVARNCEWIRIY